VDRLVHAVGSVAGVTALTAAALHIHLSLHFHRFHGPPFDYVGLALAAAVSWTIGIGPGEPLLIAAAVFSAKHKLDLSEVLLTAFLGANAGGIAGWAIGLKAGRRIVGARGPLRQMRLRALESGERIFERHAVSAVVLTPSWVAGIHRVKWPLYLPANALSAAIWAGGIGGGAFLIGPPVADMIADIGTVGLIVIGCAIAAGAAGALARRRRRAR